MTTPGVIFDIDGTLCDTNYLHAVAWARAVREVGHFVPTSVLHHQIGMGSDKLTSTVLGTHSEAATAAHSRHYAAMAEDVVAFDGAAALLWTLDKRGFRVVLATSAESQQLQLLRKVIDADDVIYLITDSGDVEASKPDPDIFQVALKGSGLDPDISIVVGDTVWDVEGARRAGMSCVCVLSGGFSEQELTDAGAVAVYADVGQLLEGLDESPIAALLNA